MADISEENVNDLFPDQDKDAPPSRSLRSFRNKMDE
jgi:hypothetical protein